MYTHFTETNFFTNLQQKTKWDTPLFISSFSLTNNTHMQEHLTPYLIPILDLGRISNDFQCDSSLCYYSRSIGTFFHLSISRKAGMWRNW